MCADANRSSMLSIALDASAKKKPIILTSTKTVTTTKTTRHICLGENGEEYQLGLNDLESFLEEEPKRRVVKKKNALTPRLSSNQRASGAGSAEPRKRKKIMKSPAIKARAQQWTESDTEANTTDDESGHRALMSSNDKENDEIFSNTVDSCVRDQPPAEANEFGNENSSPATEPTGRTKKKSKRQISKKKPKRDINEIVEEPLSLPVDVDVTRVEIHHEPRSSPRKLSAIFETSAEATANLTQYPSPPTLDKSPLIEKMVSKHYKEVHNSSPPNISLNETSAHEIATDNPLPSPAVILPRRTTRVFSSKMIRPKLYPDDGDNDAIVSAPSKRKKRRNAKKSTKMQPLPEIEEIPIQSNENETETAPVTTPPADGLKSKTRRNAKKAYQPLVDIDEIVIAIQGDQNDIEMAPVASPLANGLKLKTRRKKPIKADTRPAAVQSSQHTISDVIVSATSNDSASNTPPAEAHKPKSRRKNGVNTNLVSVKEGEVVHGNQDFNSEEVVTSPIVPTNSFSETPPNELPKRKYTKKAIKPKLNAEGNAGQVMNSNKKTALARVKKSFKHQVGKQPAIEDPSETRDTNTQKSAIESIEVGPEEMKPSSAGVAKAKRATKRTAIATTDAIASPPAKRGRNMKKPGKTVAAGCNEGTQIETANEEASSMVQNKDTELSSSAHPVQITAKIKVKPKRQPKEQSTSKALNESVLFGAPAHDEVAQEQLNYSDISTATTVFSGKSKPIIIYSPSRDKDKVTHIDGNRVVIEKAMVAKAIRNPSSGVLIGMSDNGMTIDANERLMYSPREGDEINVKKELKRGVDILNVLARRRKSVFILQCHSDEFVPK